MSMPGIDTKPNEPPGGAAQDALVHSASGAPYALDEIGLQNLWLALQRRRWRTLALVGIGSSVDTPYVGDLLARLSWRYSGQPSQVFDLRDVGMRLVEYQLRDVAARAEAGARVFMTIRSTSENPTSIGLGRFADAVVLVVGLGDSDLTIAERTIAEIGKDRVLGAVVLRRPSRSPSAGAR